MTYDPTVDPSKESVGAPEDGEIEITPEMIEAGAEIIRDLRDEMAASWIAIDVFRAMELARTNPSRRRASVVSSPDQKASNNGYQAGPRSKRGRPPKPVNPR